MKNKNKFTKTLIYFVFYKKRSISTKTLINFVFSFVFSFILLLLSFKLKGSSHDYSFPAYNAKPMTWKATIQYVPECLRVALVLSFIISIILYFYEIERRKYIKKINENMQVKKDIDIYVPLLDNETYRPVPAIYIVETMYKL